MAKTCVKPIREEGIVISKTYKEAKQARTDFNGKEWPATDEQFLVQVLSCDEDDFDKVVGFSNSTIIEYPVDKETFEKVKFGMCAKVKYEAVKYGSDIKFKPIAFTLLDKRLV